MCGIFGTVGRKDAAQVCIEGLKRLEYRGYDSAGIAGISNGDLKRLRVPGKVVQLGHLAEEETFETSVAIAHTRWATHGVPSEANAHPHIDEAGTIAVVHNGIIENHEALRTQLKDAGVPFTSDTDTEVIAHLISACYTGDLVEAVREALPQLQGSLSIAVLHQDHPEEMVVAGRESPLVIGVGEGETFVASDIHAFLVHTSEVLYLEHSEIARITANGFELYHPTAGQVQRETQTLTTKAEEVTKGDYEHYTRKEIFEQPQTIRNALLARFVEEQGTAKLDGLKLSDEELRDVRHILILACGTSWHAGLTAMYLIEEMVRVPVQVEISSEFRYQNPIVQEGTLAIVISQSGETADTIAAMREVKEKGAKVIALCNVQGSTIAREADSLLLLRAGPEIGVASTKAFTSQLTLLALFALLMGRMRGMSHEAGVAFVQELKKLPEVVAKTLEAEEVVKELAKKYAPFENFFFLGRNLMYPTALEGALKLKEIAYVNANGYPAGEMKHGPIALIGEECATVACCANQLTAEKMVSNLMEIKARRGPLLAIAPEGMEGILGVADDVIRIPIIRDELAAIPTTIVTQLFAYWVAYERGAEIDQPRNLAKSVTVE